MRTSSDLAAERAASLSISEDRAISMRPETWEEYDSLSRALLALGGAQRIRQGIPSWFGAWGGGEGEGEDGWKVRLYYPRE